MESICRKQRNFIECLNNPANARKNELRQIAPAHRSKRPVNCNVAYFLRVCGILPDRRCAGRHRDHLPLYFLCGFVSLAYNVICVCKYVLVYLISQSVRHIPASSGHKKCALQSTAKRLCGYNKTTLIFGLYFSDHSVFCRNYQKEPYMSYQQCLRQFRLCQVKRRCRTEYP